MPSTMFIGFYHRFKSIIVIYVIVLVFSIIAVIVVVICHILSNCLVGVAMCVSRRNTVNTK